MKAVSTGLIAVSLTVAPCVVQAQDESNTGLTDGAATPAVPSAEPATAAPASASTEAHQEVVGIEEIIVNARRRAESLQDIPQTVNAVTNETLEKLNIQKFEDVQAIVPGLTMSSGNTGYTTSATIRGASFQVESGATPTVEFYLNDAPIQSNFLFQSMFDLGQIEVLRGPQGTLRGRASPSGSITATTQKPDLFESGGYGMVTRSNLDGLNVQGAFSMPIIKEKLAVRIAGIDDRNRYDQIKSIHSDIKPSAQTEAFRGSLLFEPSDFISASLMYQTLRRDVRAFSGVQSFHLADPTAPVVDNDQYPEIGAGDRLGIYDSPRDTTQKQDIFTAQLDWRVRGQKLSYVGSYIEQAVDANSPLDHADIAPDYEFFQTLDQHFDHTSHELRLSSEERVFNYFDYTIGAFHLETNTPSDVVNPTLIGIQTSPTTVRPASVAYTPIRRDGGVNETSFFANLTAHITEKTELAAGLRRIEFKTYNGLRVNGAVLNDVHTKETPTIYNLSLSHRFTDGFMVYANHGKSWRDGADAVGVFRPLTPRLTQFTQLDPETSKSYEAGFKADFYDRRLRVNASVFRQDFKDYLYRGPLVYFVDLGRSGEVPNTFNFVSNVDAVVNGAELEIAARPIERFNISATFSYAKGKIDNGTVACNDFNGDGKPDQNPPAPTVDQIKQAAGGNDVVAACNINQRLAFTPYWTAVLQPEYTQPLPNNLDGFVRGLYTYNPKNTQDPNNPYDNVSAYGILNLYTGVRSHDGAWEFSIFAKNLLDENQLLGVSNGRAVTPYQQLQPPTYQTAVGTSMAGPYMNDVRYTAPREVGASIRYSFGAR